MDLRFIFQLSTTRFLTSRQRNKGTVKIFGDGKQWSCSPSSPLTTVSDDEQLLYGNKRFPRLIQRAHQLLEELVQVNERIYDAITNPNPDADADANAAPNSPKSDYEDRSLSAFVEEKMTLEQAPQEDIDTVKYIMDAMFAKTAGTSIDRYGVHEASREEEDWDYTECNFRTRGCFADVIAYHLDKIDSINR